MRHFGIDDNMTSLKKLYISVTDQDTGGKYCFGEEP